MKTQILTTWNMVMDNRFNPLRHLDARSGHFLMQVLSWMWSMIFTISFLSIQYFAHVWVAHLLVIGGIFVTITIFKRAESNRKQLVPVANLSRASKCVWQMDREA